ncbi:MAG: MBL fold metallo-hydrolase RNA specificity domain-containing protein [Desulfovibrio sp.]
MKATFLGAAQTVTGSCYIIEDENVRFAVDCGLHQGNKEIEKRNVDMKDYNPENLDFVLITHAHIDHTGLLPRLVKFGFKGKIYLTAPTKELLEIMLLDSAHIQEMEALWNNQKKMRHGSKELVEPLYTESDAESVFPLFEVVEYDKQFKPCEDVCITYRDAGHILGSSIIEAAFEGEDRPCKVVFSGDLGRPHQLLVNDPSFIESTDYLIMESTYGDRDHKDSGNSKDELAEAIRYSYRQRQKVVIPAFAVERTQQIIYTLFQLSLEGRLPDDMPVYLDSPLAIRATEIFRKHPEFFDAEFQAYLDKGLNPLDLKNLVFTQTTEESQAINNTKGPAIVISASGMANAGRIKHHLRHNLWKKGASIIFVGYQAVGTPGRKIVNGASSIRIFGEDISVEAKIFTINGFSGHAGRSELLEWLENFKEKNMKLVLTHGDPEAQQKLAEVIEERFDIPVHIPGYLEQITFDPATERTAVVAPARKPRGVDWDFLLQDSENLLTEMRKRIAEAEKLSWEEQTEIRDRLLDINRHIVEFISEL